MANDLKIVRLKGKEIIPYIHDLAALRIEVFKDFPYLYVGDMEYEEKYLKTYVSCPEAIMILVFDEDAVVGASTAIPLEFETMEVKKPFREQGIPITDVFILGESLLYPIYRGRKLYRRFFEEREAAAREYGAKIAAFFVVERSPDDLRQPEDYRPLDTVWERVGYKKHPELRWYLEWKEVGQQAATPKPMIFWLKTL